MAPWKHSDMSRAVVANLCQIKAINQNPTGKKYNNEELSGTTQLISA